MSALKGKQWVAARKPHQCIWCGETIHRNEIYQYNVYADGGFHFRQRWHVECHFASFRELEYGEEFQPYEFERPTTEPYTRTIECYQ